MGFRDGLPKVIDRSLPFTSPISIVPWSVGEVVQDDNGWVGVSH